MCHRLTAALAAAARAVVALLLAALLALLRRSWRVRVHGERPRGGVLLACWHGDLIALLAAPLVPRPTVLVSRSRDGAIAALAARLLGYGVVRGSSSRGAVPGARGMVRALRDGLPVALAVDGPRGPRERTTSAARRIAALAGASVVPLAARARPAIRLGSWDRMLLPLPFARVEIGLGAPGTPSLQGSLDSLRSRLAAVLGVLALLTALACDPGGERMRQALASRDPTTRADAIERLAETRDRGAVELVAAHLKDPSPRVRRAAVAAIASLGGTRSQLGRLIDRLQDGDLEVRIASARALGDSGDPRARQALVTALEDSSPIARRAASAALSALGLTPSAQASALAGQRLDGEIARLRHPDEQIRASAARELGLGERGEAVSALASALTGSSALVAREAALALGRIGTAEAARELLARARSADPGRRAAAARGIALLEGEAAARSLVALLADPVAEVRAAGFAALGARRPGPLPAEVASAVCRAFGSDTPTALAAARILGARGVRCPAELAALLTRDPKLEQVFEIVAAARDPGATAAVLSAARRRYQAHRESAVAWIPAPRWRELDGEDGNADPVPDPGPPPKGDRTRGDPGKRPALERILRRFPDPTREVEEEDPLLPASVPVSTVVQAIQAVGERATEPAARDWLAEVALEAPPAIRAAALVALAGSRPAATAPPPATRPVEPSDAAGRAVWTGLRSDRLEVRRAAAAGCVLLGAGAAAAAMTMLADRDFELRQAGARCAAALRLADAVPRLIELLREERSSSVIRALGSIGDARAQAPLEALLQEEPAGLDLGFEERALVASALGELAVPASAPALERELGHPDWRVRLAAARALARAPRRASRAALEVCRADFVAEVRRACDATLRALPR